MMKNIRGILLGLGLAGAANAGVIAGFDFTTDTAASTVASGAAAAEVEGAGGAADFAVAALGDNSGYLASGTQWGSTVDGSFGGVSYLCTQGSLDNAIVKDDYITFSISSDAGYSLNLTGLSLSTAMGHKDRTATDYNILAQVNGGTSWMAADALTSNQLVEALQNDSEYTDTYVDLSDAAFQGVTSVVFRIYLWGANGTKSSSAFRLDQLAVEGFVVSDSGGNQAPVANALQVSTLPGTALDITLTGADAEGSSLTFSVGTPANGTLTGTAPNLTYTPADAYRGEDRFTFTVNDGDLDSDPATVTISVTNQLPTADAQSLSTSYDTALGITLTGSDPEESSLTFTVGAPTNGTLSGTAPNLTYTPDSGYTGTDGFSFTVNDGFDDSASAIISISVINELPVADPISTATLPATPVAITLSGSDAEGEDLTYTVIDTLTNGILSGTAPNLTYTPTNGTVGTDGFTYTVNDGRDDSAAAAVSILIANESADVLAGYDFDDGTGAATTNATLTDDHVTASIYDVGAGLISVVSTGANSLSEYADAEGNLFGTASDLSFGGPQGTFGFVDMGNANNLAAAITQEDYMTFTVTAAAGYEMDLSRLTFRTRVNQLVNSAERWALFSSVDGFTAGAEIATGRTVDIGTWSGASNNITVDLSAAAFQKLAVITFRLYIYGGDNASNSATLYDKVILHGAAVSDSVNRAPTADDQSLSTLSGTALAVTLTGTDPEGSDLTYTVGTPDNGMLTGTAPDLTYTPDAGFVGTDSFSFTVNDGLLDSDTATVTIDVQNQAAVADAQRLTTSPGTPLDITLTASDPENASLTYTVVDMPTNGMLTGTAPELTYTPTNGASGADRLTFYVNDGYEDSASAMVSIYVADYAAEILAGYDFDDGTGSATTAVTEKNANVTASDFGVGAGLSNVVSSVNALAEYTDAEGNIFGTANEFSFGGPQSSFGFKDMNDRNSLNEGITADDYMTFTVTPDAGHALDLSRFTFRTFARTLANSAERWALFSSVGGFTNGAEIVTGQTTNANVFVSNVVDLSGAAFQGLEGAVEFRLVIYGGDNGSNSSTLFDKVILHGTTSGAVSGPEVSIEISGGGIMLAWDGGATYNVMTNSSLTNSAGWGVVEANASSPVNYAVGSEEKLFFQLSE